MKRVAASLLVLLALAGFAPARAENPDSDPRAVKVARAVMKSLGGREGWDALPGLSWTFEVSVHDTIRSSRKHAWNKLTGEHRVEGTLRDGSPFVIVHVLGDSTKGAAWVNKNPLEGDSLAHMIKRAQAMWVNDSYWFLMPYKMLDPGVTLQWKGELKDSTGAYDRIGLSFHNVGLTPGDRYEVFVHRGTNRVERWEYQLQGTQPPPQKATWEGWQQHDGLWFPTEHRAGAAIIFTHDVHTMRSFPPSEFRDL
jgi:hypothetical protein